MLHIILGIIKLIGIILGVLLLLLLAAALAAVFVPVRYQIQAKKQEDEVCAGIKASWLLHIVSIFLKINKQAEHEMVIRLFGIRLPLFGTKKKKRRAKRHTDPVKRKEPGRMREDPEGEDILKDMEDDDILKDLEDELLPENDGILEDDAAPAETPGILIDGCASEDKAPANGQRESGKIRFSFRWICDRIKEVYGKLKAFIMKLSSLISGLAKKAAELPQKILALSEKAGALARKIRELAGKPGQMLELAEKLEADKVLRDILGYLTYLLRHYAPRRIRGFLRFGTGDPAVTGQLTGLIYLILPARADHFTVQPEFGDAVLETEISCKGHIRAVHLIRVLWWGFRSKRLRRILRYRSRG